MMSISRHFKPLHSFHFGAIPDDAAAELTKGFDRSFKIRAATVQACLILIFGLGLALGPESAVAEVTRVKVDRREPFAKGQEFGDSGAYEIIEGRLFFEVDPKAAANERITDLSLAPTNGSGKVEFQSDFFLLKPLDATLGNGCLLYDVHNRGNKLALWTFNEGERTNQPLTIEHAGNEFLLKNGYSVLWTGWDGDVIEDGEHRLIAELPIATGTAGEPISGPNYVEISVDEPTKSRQFFWSPWGTSDAYPAASLDEAEATLTMRERRADPAIEIPRDDWSFARWEDDKLIADATSLYVKDGLKPGWLYDLVYTARDPRVSGLGLAGLRDAVSFFRHPGADNPLGGAIDRSCVFGISQAGRLIHHFLYEGLNTDTQSRQVFDGAIIHVAGAGKGMFNYRFGMATVYGTQHRGNLSPSDFFPFTPMPQTDPVTGRSGDSLARLRQAGHVPKIFFVQTSTEYWERAASLLHTDVEGKQDLELDPSVRIYNIAGAAHLGAVAAEPGNSQNPRNPLRHRGPVLRALLVALDDWMSNGTEPPASSYPRIDDGTLVDLQSFRTQFSKIPGVALPTSLNQPLRLDSGPRWHSAGIADQVPPIVGAAFVALVPAVGPDGNELAGIRLPEVAAPLATFAGWNLRSPEIGAVGALAGLHGSYLEFPRTKAGRGEDSRASIEALYPTRTDYLDAYTNALLQLRDDGFLLDFDVSELQREAAEREL